MDARALTLELLSWPSVTGSEGERAFGPRLRERLAGAPRRGDVARGRGRRALHRLRAEARARAAPGVVLAGHYDVVDDTGVVPFDPGPDWLAGRGALDMKSGLAALIVALARHAATRPRRATCCCVACPDEEAHSAGARAAAQAIRRLDLDWRLGINARRRHGWRATAPTAAAVFCGGVGKLLLCALLRGVPAHVGEPLLGLSAHWLAAEVVRAVEGQPAGARRAAARPARRRRHQGAVYDVTMPRDVLLVFNLLTHDAPDVDAGAASARGSPPRSTRRWRPGRAPAATCGSSTPTSRSPPPTRSRSRGRR